MNPTPTTDHITPTNGACTASPSTDVTFVSVPAQLPPVNTNVTLPDPTGPDGRRKAIVLEQGDTNYHVIPTHFATGTRVDFTGSGGVCTFIWDVHTKLWYLESTTNGTLQIT